MTVFSDKLSGDPNRFHVEIAQIIKDHQIRVTPWRNGALALQTKVFSGIDGRHANGFDRIDPAGYRAPDNIIDVPFSEHVIGRSIVGTQTKVTTVFPVDRGT